MARITGLFEQTFRNLSGQGPSNQPVTFAIIQSEERAGGQAQDPLCNTAFMWSIILIPGPTAIDAFASESWKTKSHEDIDYEKIPRLEARVKAIEGADLYDLVQVTEICLVLNIIVPKNFHVPKFIKYTGTQCPTIYLKSYYNKMTEVVHNGKLLMHLFQDSLIRVAPS
jgi:hypothetical protein